MFKYKTNKHGNLNKCKAKLMICGNQQQKHDFPTKVTTLPITSFCVLLAITIKFDLEILQFDTVNAFVHANINKIVYIRMLAEYKE